MPCRTACRMSQSAFAGHTTCWWLRTLSIGRRVQGSPVLGFECGAVRASVSYTMRTPRGGEAVTSFTAAQRLRFAPDNKYIRKWGRWLAVLPAAAATQTAPLVARPPFRWIAPCRSTAVLWQPAGWRVAITLHGGRWWTGQHSNLCPTVRLRRPLSGLRGLLILRQGGLHSIFQLDAFRGRSAA